jgi:hypothetical protein
VNAASLERSKECQQWRLAKTDKSSADQNPGRTVVGQPAQRFSRESLHNQPLAVKYAPREWPFAEPRSGLPFCAVKTGLPAPVGGEFQTSSFDVSDSWGKGCPRAAEVIEREETLVAEGGFEPPPLGSAPYDESEVRASVSSFVARFGVFLYTQRVVMKREVIGHVVPRTMPL